MASIVLEKIQLRRGLAADLPGAPTSMSPVAFAPGLDEGELGYVTDLGRLFVGIGSDAPTSGMPNYARTAFPYLNIEVLTENSPLGVIFGNAIRDNQAGYMVSTPLTQTTSFLNLQTLNAAGVATDFYLDLAASGTNVHMYYAVFDSSLNAIRQGRLNVLWNKTFVTAPLCTDEAEVAVGSINALQFQAAMVNAGLVQHVVMRYINQTGNSPKVYFRLDRPSTGAMSGPGGFAGSGTGSGATLSVSAPLTLTLPATSNATAKGVVMALQSACEMVQVAATTDGSTQKYGLNLYDGDPTAGGVLIYQAAAITTSNYHDNAPFFLTAPISGTIYARVTNVDPDATTVHITLRYLVFS